MHLNKTSILAGLNCEKRLFLMLHHPELGKARKSPLAETGIVVGEHARDAFPGGVLVNRFKQDADPFSETDACINDENIPAIFEAGFRHEDTEVFVDILERAGASWNLIEVKSSSSVKDEYIDDVTVQYMVLTRAGMAIKRVELMYLNKDFTYHADKGYDGLFIREDLSDRVLPHSRHISDQVDQLRQNMSDAEPVRHVNGHCKKPYDCEFRNYCEKQDGEYPVSWLPNAAKAIERLHANAIYDIRNIPADMLTSDTHRKIRRITVNGHAELDPGAARILGKLEYPRYYLDFETIKFAIPVWDGTRPNQQHPFQWSCHVQHADGRVAHRDFLDVSGCDPRRQFAETLIAACGNQGPVVVYNQTFEKGVIKNLAGQHRDLSSRLLAINERVFDLLPVMKQYYYHPDMKGSWSIKNVLSCLVPELRYSDLGEVQDGLMAQNAYFEILNGQLSEDEREALSLDMLEYCKLDTYAMLAIVNTVCNQKVI
jgi:hypothetical protein